MNTENVNFNQSDIDKKYSCSMCAAGRRIGPDGKAVVHPFGVIGRNFVVEWMMQAAEAVGITPTACLSRTAAGADEFGEKHGIAPIKRYTDLQKFASDPDVEFVYIASPNALHESQALALIAAGKHVLCEKPAALSTESLDRITAAAKERGVVFMEAMPSVYMPGTEKLHELVGKIGVVRRATLSFCQYSSRYDKFKRGIIENAFNPEIGGGAMRDIGIYCAAMLFELFGRPDEMYANTITLPESIEAEGTVLCKYNERDGRPAMLAELIYSKITDRPFPSVIEGEDATLTVDSLSRPKKITVTYRKSAVPADGARPGFSEGESYDFSSDTPDMVYELRAFLDRIEGTYRDPYGEISRRTDNTRAAAELLDMIYNRN